MPNEVGKKMSEYTALASGEKDYFFRDGEGSVVTVGKVAQGGSDVNRLVKLSDLAGKSYTVEAPITNSGYEIGLSYNQNHFTVSSDSLCLENPVPTPGASHADAGKVLTVKTNPSTNVDEIVWDTASSVAVDGATITNTNNTLSVNYGGGLQVGSGALMAKIEANGGLDLSAGNALMVTNPVPTPGDDHADADKVLSVKTNSSTGEDEIVWAAPQAGSSIPNPPADHSSKSYVLGIGTDGNFKWVELMQDGQYDVNYRPQD